MRITPVLTGRIDMQTRLGGLSIRQYTCTTVFSVILQIRRYVFIMGSRNYAEYT